MSSVVNSSSDIAARRAARLARERPWKQAQSQSRIPKIHRVAPTKPVVSAVTVSQSSSSVQTNTAQSITQSIPPHLSIAKAESVAQPIAPHLSIAKGKSVAQPIAPPSSVTNRKSCIPKPISPAKSIPTAPLALSLSKLIRLKLLLQAPNSKIPVAILPLRRANLIQSKLLSQTGKSDIPLATVAEKKPLKSAFRRKTNAPKTLVWAAEKEVSIFRKETLLTRFQPNSKFEPVIDKPQPEPTRLTHTDHERESLLGRFCEEAGAVDEYSCRGKENIPIAPAEDKKLSIPSFEELIHTAVTQVCLSDPEVQDLLEKLRDN